MRLRGHSNRVTCYLNDPLQQDPFCASSCNRIWIFSLFISLFQICTHLQHKFKRMAQLNFSGPWENINTLFQYLLFPLNKTLPNLTLPDQNSIPFPNPAGGTHPRPAWGHLTPAPNPDNL